MVQPGLSKDGIISLQFQNLSRGPKGMVSFQFQGFDIYFGGYFLSSSIGKFYREWVGNFLTDTVLVHKLLIHKILGGTRIQQDPCKVSINLIIEVNKLFLIFFNSYKFGTWWW